MLELRVDGFTVPAAEVELGPITPTVAFANIGDEGAYVTGLVRVYRISTGLMVYDSQLTPTTIEAGASATIEALTPWLPPAPAEDDYFVNGWASAVSTGCQKVPWSGNIPALYFDITAPPPGPYPDPHASTHESGGSDPLDIALLAGTLDHGALGGLGDDDHPQYQLITHADYLRVRPLGSFREDDIHGNSTFYTTPWQSQAIAAGAGNYGAGLPNHPGILSFRSSVNANSGFALRLSATSFFLLAGGEECSFVLRPLTLALTSIRLGFHDCTTSVDATDGVYLESVAGLVSGKTASNSARSTTATNYLMVTNTWYQGHIVLNADASLASFYLYSEAGALLWTDTLATNIPTASGRELGHGTVATNSGTTALNLVELDYHNFWVARALVR